MKKNTHTSPIGFSIIEVMIGIFVFSLWLVSIFALLASSLNVNELNKNSIIAGQLAREQIELVRNIRDTNYKNLKLWNQQDPSVSLSKTPVDETIDPDKVFFPDNYYFVENNYANGEIIVDNLWSSLLEGQENLSSMIWNYDICFDSENRYVRCSGSNIDATKFFKYLKVEKAQDDLWNDIENAYILTSKVIWYVRGYHEFEIKTIITDWRRI